MRRIILGLLVSFITFGNAYADPAENRDVEWFQIGVIDDNRSMPSDLQQGNPTHDRSVDQRKTKDREHVMKQRHHGQEMKQHHRQERKQHHQEMKQHRMQERKQHHQEMKQHRIQERKQHRQEMKQHRMQERKQHRQ